MEITKRSHALGARFKVSGSKFKVLEIAKRTQSRSFELRISLLGLLSDFGSSEFGFPIIQLRMGGGVH
jgi:hypothetical protein